MGNSSQISIINERRINSSHEFDWEKKVENNLNKRLILETIHIKDQFNIICKLILNCSICYTENKIFLCYRQSQFAKAIFVVVTIIYKL